MSTTPDSSWFWERLGSFGDQAFLHHRGQSHTYQQLATRMAELERVLSEEKIGAGEVVVLLSDYSLEAVSWFLALARNKNVVVPVVSEVQEEIDLRIQESYADVVVRIPSEGAPVIERTDDDRPKHDLVNEVVDSKAAGVVIFSSGSTGVPKAMIHDLDQLISVHESRRTRKLVILLFLMFDHIGGLNTFLTILATGGALVVPEERDAEEVAGLIEAHKVAVLPTTPTFLNLMLISEATKKHDCSSLRIITYGTEPMPESLLEGLRGIFPRAKFLQTFGTSETGIAKTSSKDSSSTLLKLDDDPGSEYKIVDGVLWLRSATQIKGYLNHDSDQFTEDGWFITGDIVEEEGDGYLRIVGRSKEVINVGGQKVLPSEVESVLLSMPEVSDCLVYGEPNAITGHGVTARVVLAGEVDLKKGRRLVRTYCREKLDAYKVPSKVLISDSIDVGGRFKKKRIQS